MQRKEIKMRLTKPHKTIILKYTLFVFVCVAFGWFLKGKMSPSGQKAGFGQGVPYVLIQAVKEVDTLQAKTTIGHVEAINEVSLQPEVSGTVEDVLFQEGSFVQTGDILFKIDAQIFQATLDLRKAELAAAEAGLTEAERNYNRQIKLSKQNIASQATFDNAESTYLKAKAAVEQAKAGVELAQIDYDRTSIQSPINGYIGKALVTKGNRVVASQQVLAKIVQIDPVRVVFTLTDKEYLNFSNDAEITSEGLKARIVLPNGQTIIKPFLSVFVNNEVSTDTATVSIYGDFDNKDEQLVPGSYVQIAMLFEPEMNILIPQAALAQDENGFFTFVVGNDNIAEERRLEMGDVIGQMQIVKNGLKQGEKVVIKGIQKLSNGMPVQASTVSEKSEL